MKETPSYEELLDIVKPYLPEDVDPASIGPESHLVEELNINSAHLVDIVLDLEDKYGIEMDNDDMDAMQTVSQAVALIKDKLAAQS